jgi:hypothetical protein
MLVGVNHAADFVGGDVNLLSFGINCQPGFADRAKRFDIFWSGV